MQITSLQGNNMLWIVPLELRESEALAAQRDSRSYPYGNQQ